MKTKKKTNWRKNPPIKNPYGAKELIIDLIIGGQAGLIIALYYQDSAIFWMTEIAAIFSSFHYAITLEANHWFYLRNKRKRAEREQLIQAELEKRGA